MWFEEISFRGFPRKLKSVGRTAAAETAAAETDQKQLEQLERLRSEDTPPLPRDYPYYWPVRFESQVHTIDQFISDPKSNEGESRKN